MKERRACTDYRPLHNAAFCQNIVWGQFEGLEFKDVNILGTLPRNDLLSRLYWGA